jgi:hypothetical protein
MNAHDINAGVQFLLLVYELIFTVAGIIYLRAWMRERRIGWRSILKYSDQRLVAGFTLETFAQAVGVAGYLIVWPALSAGRLDLADPIVQYGAITGAVCTVITGVALVLVLWPIFGKKIKGTWVKTAVIVTIVSALVAVAGAALNAILASVWR